MLKFKPFNETGINRRDCVTRAVATVTGLGYNVVYDELDELCWNVPGWNRASSGVPTENFRVQKWLKDLGFIKVNTPPGLTLNQITPGRWLVRCHRHLTAVIGDTIIDSWDPRTKNRGLVYGIYAYDDRRGVSRLSR